MKAESTTLAALAAHFAALSLLAIGGANAVVPEMHREAVDTAHWMSARQFADLFAIAQVSPGPNVIIVTLIGYQVAGISGAIVATLAMCGPSCLATYVIAQTWDRFKQARWRTIVEAGLVPVSVGLIAATALVLARAADRSVAQLAITVGTAILAYATRINPLWAFAVAALAGLAGLT